MEGTVGLPLLLSVGSHKEERQLPTFSIKGNNSVLISCGFTWELSLKEPDSICHKLSTWFLWFFFSWTILQCWKTNTSPHIPLKRPTHSLGRCAHWARFYFVFFFCPCGKHFSRGTAFMARWGAGMRNKPLAMMGSFYQGMPCRLRFVNMGWKIEQFICMYMK